MEETNKAAAVLKHPLRLRIVQGIGGGALSPKDLAASLGEPLGNVAYHVRELCAAGVLRKAGTRPVRGAVQHFYRYESVGVLEDARRFVSVLEEAGRV